MEEKDNNNNDIGPGTKILLSILGFIFIVGALTLWFSQMSSESVSVVITLIIIAVIIYFVGGS